MGIRSYLIATAAFATLLAATAQAQVARHTPAGEHSAMEAASQKGGAGTDAKGPSRAQPSTRAERALPPGFSPSIVNRPAVRREAQPVPRRSVRAAREAPPAAAAVATGTVPIQAAATSPAGGVERQVAQAQPAPAAAPPSPRRPAPAPGPAAAPAAGTAVGVAAGAAAAAAAAAPAGAPASRDVWTAQDIELARAHCTAILRSVDAVLTPEDPIKEGECGSPVVYKVSAISKGPVIELSPPVTLTCDMVAALDKWTKRDVQPRARALLGGSVVRIETMSSYSCRNAYGRKLARLSEHGKANAIDIASFSTAKDTTTVLAGWGMTQRELKVIAARKEAERAAATAAAQGRPGTLPQTGPPATAGSGQQNVLPGLIITQPVPPPMLPQSGLGLGPQRLGGPKGEARVAPAAPAAQDSDNRRRFLHEIHAAACKIFGTVLGPEANNAHKNHFHLDMAQRQRGSFCE